MLGIIAILLVSMYLAFIFPVFKKKAQKPELSDKTSLQVKKLWQIAQSSMHDRKPLRAEKALLAILHVDEKNAAAYNRLGIIYAKSQKFDEAIECFEIAQSLDENASSLHNVGLIYLETGEYEKAAMAFKQALDLESDSPARCPSCHAMPRPMHVHAADSPAPRRRTFPPRRPAVRDTYPDSQAR